jgi:hypothetical protein
MLNDNICESMQQNQSICNNVRFQKSAKTFFSKEPQSLTIHLHFFSFFVRGY